MSYTTTTITGNTTAPAELSTTQGGKQVARLRVAVQEAKDKPSSFYNVTVWDDMAKNVAATFTDKGMRVIVEGRLVVREYEDKNGNKRISVDVTAESIGPDLRFAVATARRADGQNGPNAGRGTGVGGAGAAGWGTSVPNASSGAPGASQDVWAQPDQTWNPASDEMPF